METVIRRATAADAEVVHKIVLLALRETNARDYPSSVIERLVLTLPDKVASNLETWCAFVATIQLASGPSSETLHIRDRDEPTAGQAMRVAAPRKRTLPEREQPREARDARQDFELFR